MQIELYTGDKCNFVDYLRNEYYNHWICIHKKTSDEEFQIGPDNEIYVNTLSETAAYVNELELIGIDNPKEFDDLSDVATFFIKNGIRVIINSSFLDGSINTETFGHKNIILYTGPETDFFNHVEEKYDDHNWLCVKHKQYGSFIKSENKHVVYANTLRDLDVYYNDIIAIDDADKFFKDVEEYTIRDFLENRKIIIINSNIFDVIKS